MENVNMSSLAKLTIKTVARPNALSPTEARRQKLLKAIEVQLHVAEAAVRGESYAITLSRWAKNDAGERVRVQRQRIVPRWFFERDGGCYVQCKYGSRAIALSKDGNAVFVKQLGDVKPALEALYAAASAGELDGAILSVINVRKNQQKVGASAS